MISNTIFRLNSSMKFGRKASRWKNKRTHKIRIPYFALILCASRNEGINIYEAKCLCHTAVPYKDAYQLNTNLFPILHYHLQWAGQCRGNDLFGKYPVRVSNGFQHALTRVFHGYPSLCGWTYFEIGQRRLFPNPLSFTIYITWPLKLKQRR